jgi:hypothetical protein
MRQLDFYEFTGILLPGAIVMTALVLLFPGWGLPTLVKDVSVGGLGIFIVLAYAVGHIVQAVGNVVESAWWKCWGGMPTPNLPDCWRRSRFLYWKNDFASSRDCPVSTSPQPAQAIGTRSRGKFTPQWRALDAPVAWIPSMATTG